MTRLRDAERELALHYAPRDCRRSLRALWLLDERMGAIVAETSEPTIGEMRLLWWREALENLHAKVPSEPLLIEIGALREDVALAVGQWGSIAEGWHALLQEPLETEDLKRFGRERGGRLFALSGAIAGGSIDGLERAGAVWALADLAAHSSSESLAAAAREAAREELSAGSIRRWPVRLRALGALTVIARREVIDGRAGRKGSPRRLARMMWNRLTGL